MILCLCVFSLFLFQGFVVVAEDINTAKIEHMFNQVHQWQNKVEKLENLYQKTKDELGDTKAKLDTTVKELERTKYKLVEVEEKIGTYMTPNTEKTENKVALEKRLLENDPSTIQTNVHNLMVSVATLQTDVSDLKSRALLNYFVGQGVKRGFTARISHNVHDLGYNQLIVFDDIVSNIGNNYNPASGMFTCEIPGVYVFFVHTLTISTKHVETEIVKNSQSLVYTYAHDKEDYSSGSNLVVIELAAGDIVFVRASGNAHDVVGDVLDAWYTSFSGFLIKS